MTRLQHRIIALASLCTLALLTSCASNDSPGSLRSDPLRSGELDERRVQRLPAKKLYKAARDALNSSDYTTAIQLYDRLDAQFPFTEYATQGKLEAIYAHHRAYQPELALSAADRFIRANPRHKHLDYVLYLRGLVNFERGASAVMDALNLDTATRDPINARRAFEDFSRLLQRFPESIYAPDARQRMIYLRNRIARHEMAIAEFYAGRRAWVAASSRARDILRKFQGSEVIPDALALLARCYDELELTDRAAEVRGVLAATFPKGGRSKPAQAEPVSRPAPDTPPSIDASSEPESRDEAAASSTQPKAAEPAVEPAATPAPAPHRGPRRGPGRR